MKFSGKPNYKRIYSDMIDFKYPERKSEFKSYLDKKELTILDVIFLDKKLFNNRNQEANKLNQRLKSYDLEMIMEILKFQKENNLTNTELAQQLSMSRNTIASWKKKL